MEEGESIKALRKSIALTFSFSCRSSGLILWTSSTSSCG